MKSIKEAVLLSTKEELEAEIQARKDLILQMVGTLYPDILTDEVIKIYQRKVELFGEDLSFRPRGIGSDQGGCFICGEGSFNSNIAAFVKTKFEGERVVEMFKSIAHGARLDYRPTEPDWIQVKVCACKKHFGNLELLYELTKNDCVINLKKIKEAIETSPEVLKRNW